ncbi:MAG: competence protein ComEC [Patiriisocius sp.]
MLLVQSIYFFEEKTANEKEAFIVFHKSRFSIIGRRIGVKMNLQENLETIQPKEIKAVKSYRVAEYMSAIEKVNFKNYIRFNEQDILLIDSLGVYQLQKLEKPIVVLQYSPKINLERVIQVLKPSLIIADGSNYKSDVNNWELIALKNKIRFHYTGKKGAFILEY